MPARIPSQVGLKFGRLTVISEEFDKGKRTAHCLCDCGNSHKANAHKLKTGHTTSCGCYNLDRLKAPRIESQIGKRYGRLTVIHDGMTGGVNRKLIARCDCGNEVKTKLSYARSGHTNSCGCYKMDTLIERSTKHSMCNTPEYATWANMIQRCTNPKGSNYSYYGGRGIKVCDEWFEFENFIRDMGRKPAEGYSIDRINNDGNYCKENCRWADRFTQMNNTRKNIKKPTEISQTER
jgi:hypothetical protein